MEAAPFSAAIILSGTRSSSRNHFFLVESNSLVEAILLSRIQLFVKLTVIFSESHFF